MISFIAPHVSGNAIRLLLLPPKPADAWIVLRKNTDTFTGVDDPDAFVAYAGLDRYFLDTMGLMNGEAVFYRAYYFIGVSLVGETLSYSVTPGSSFISQSVDAVSIVRDRIDLGLQALIERGMLHHPRNLIPVMIASPLIEETLFPVVTVHLISESSELRGIGEAIGSEECEGWYSRYQLEVIGWSLNSDQRKLLRNSLKHILVANLSVFDFYEFENIDVQFSDHEDFQTYQAPMYTANCTLRFLAPSLIRIPQDQVTIIDIQTIVSV